MKLKIVSLVLGILASCALVSADDQEITSIEKEYHDQQPNTDETTTDHHVHVDEAHEKASAGKYDEALEALNRAIKLNPQSPRAYRMRGNIYFAQKQYDKALADFEQLVKLRPDHALPYTSRAVVEYSMKNYGPALTDINKALTIDPNNEFAKEVRENIIREATGQNKPAKPKKKVVYHKQLG